MSKIDFIFLHGFLGLPADWNDVIENIKVDLEEVGIEGEYHCLDYFNRPNIGPKNSLDKIGIELVNHISATTRNPRKILVGYSLGGRLGLHAFEKNPDMFEHFVCVSVHPGLKPNQFEEIKERESRDQFWSELFLNHNWEEVIQKWNEQSVFEGSEFEPEREGTNYRRDLLAKALVNWSLAKQADKRNVLRKYHKKVTWVLGERDKKFIEMTRALILETPGIKVDKISLAGHRVIFDNSLELGRAISDSVIPKKKNP